MTEGPTEETFVEEPELPEEPSKGVYFDRNPDVAPRNPGEEPLPEPVEDETDEVADPIDLAAQQELLEMPSSTIHLGAGDEMQPAEDTTVHMWWAGGSYS